MDKVFVVLTALATHTDSETEENTTTVNFTNLKWMLSSSTYMIECRKGRCALGKLDEKKNGLYILGGWCIGTVLDGAASRLTSLQRTAKNTSGSAMKVYVNVGWW